jgi:hypothetical protein
MGDILQVAKNWLARSEKSHTRCRRQSEQQWYPTRLIDLEGISPPDGSERMVRLVLTKDQKENDIKIEGPYVTLSHCWGQAKPLCLTEENFPDFQRGISLDSLPQTFRDAMQFASGLGVRYIWIDSLCIKQRHVADWLSESAEMHEV